MKHDHQKFRQLFSSRDRVARGREFERILADVLVSAGFDVDLDSPAARPRQTDLLVEHEGQIYLWELKWHSRPTTIEHVHGLRDRVRQMRPGVVGVLCSVSGFAKPVLEDVARNRSIEILLVDGFEIYHVIDRGLDIADLLEKKRFQLTRRARVWFLEDRKSTPATRSSPLPRAQERVGSSIERPYVSMEIREIEDILFTRHPLMFDEYGPGVPVLRLRLDAIEDLKDLEHLLGILHKELRFVDDPEFSIRQTNAMWNGVGAREFLKCAADIQLRYADAKTDIHHSEELWIFAEIPDGVMMLSIRQRSSPPYRLDSGELMIRVATLPLDLGAYQRVAKAVGERRPGFSIESPLETHHFHLSNPLDVSPLETITTDEYGDRTIVGMFVRNPLLGKPELLKQLARTIDHEGTSRTLSRLTDTSLLGCWVKDWIPETEEVTGWQLLGFNVVLIGELWVLHCTCTWIDKKQWEQNELNEEALRSIGDFDAERLSGKELERVLRAWRERRLSL